jgi:hypothetical protein
MEKLNHENSERQDIDEAETLIERFRVYEGRAFPLADAKRALELESEIRPLLLRHLKEATLDLKGSLERGEWFLTIFSIYTLAYFRDVSAQELILRICKQPIEYTEELLGDGITENLHRILASTFSGDFESYKSIILNRQLDQYVRASVFRTFIVLYHWKSIPRENFVDFVIEILDSTPQDDTTVLIELEDACYILKDEQLLVMLTQIVDPRELEVSFSGNKAIRAEFPIESQKRIKYVEESSFYDHVPSPTVEMSSWSGFKEEKYNQSNKLKRKVMPKTDESIFGFDLNSISPLERVGPKLGRNDPCYCLSGKKFKKCCLPLELEKQKTDLKKAALQEEYVKEVEKHISRGCTEFPNFGFACVHLLKAWDLLKVKIDPNIPSLEYIERVYRFSIDLKEFLHNLEFAFLEAAKIDKTYAEKGLIFYREVLDYGVDTYAGGELYLKSNMAQILYSAGQEREADSLVRNIIDEWPHNTEGYWCAAELARLRSAPLSESLLWYEKALENDVVDANDYQLNDAIMALKSEILQLEERKA